MYLMKNIDIQTASVWPPLKDKGMILMGFYVALFNEPET